MVQLLLDQPILCPINLMVECHFCNVDMRVRFLHGTPVFCCLMILGELLGAIPRGYQFDSDLAMVVRWFDSNQTAIFSTAP